MTSQFYVKSGISILVLIIFTLFSTQKAHAQNLSFTTDTDWTFTATGALPVFLVTSEHEEYGAGGESQFASRVMSGFNPGNITFSVAAPEVNGISVSGMFQINHHLQGPSIQNEGLFEGRIADIVISGDFGTFNVGKGFGVFNSIAIGDLGSAAGVGRFSGPDAANATLGRIGTGYTYANFNPRVSYTTPDIGGVKSPIWCDQPGKTRWIQHTD